MYGFQAGGPSVIRCRSGLGRTVAGVSIASPAHDIRFLIGVGEVPGCFPEHVVIEPGAVEIESDAFRYAGGWLISSCNIEY